MCLCGSASCHLVFLPFSTRRACPGLATGPRKIPGANATQSQVWNQAQVICSLPADPHTRKRMLVVMKFDLT